MKKIYLISLKLSSNDHYWNRSKHSDNFQRIKSDQEKKYLKEKEELQKEIKAMELKVNSNELKSEKRSWA